MSDHAPSLARAEVLARLRVQAKQLFAEHPELDSLMLSVAQYWNDQADDECHAHLIASARTVPEWPHECSDYEAEVWDSARADMIPNLHRREGELCSSCGYTTLDAPSLDVFAWEPYCHEHAGQDQDVGTAYMPYAILRRGDTGVELEVIGRLQRAHAELVTGEPRREPWATVRARELFALVCANPDDDGPRAVLADHLLESRASALDPRGEYLALSLAPTLDAAARARRDELLAAHEREWIAPLGPAIPMGCATFARGFLARADIFATEQIGQGSATWGTVETLRFLPGSIDMIDGAMVGLRDVGPIGPRGVKAIARAPRPWRIETLHVTDGALGLRDAATLPALSHLILGAAALDSLDELARASWWSQLERVTLTVGEDGPPTHWFARHRALHPLPWLAIACVGENAEPAGWQLAFGPRGAVEVSVPGWHPQATLTRLVELLRELPPDAVITLVDSAYRVFTDDDRTLIQTRLGREL